MYWQDGDEVWWALHPDGTERRCWGKQQAMEVASGTVAEPTPAPISPTPKKKLRFTKPKRLKYTIK